MDDSFCSDHVLSIYPGYQRFFSRAVGIFGVGHPKYRVENRRNNDTASMIGHAYLMLYPSCVFFFYVKHVCTRASAFATENRREKT